MRNIRWLSIACLVPVAVFSCRAAFAVFPHTYTVGPNALTCDFTTIQAAVQASTTSGDTIVLAYGATYTEHVDIADRSLTIKSGASCLLGGATPSAPAESTPSVFLSGPGNDNVFAITGNSHITLIDLDILNGKKSPGNGGAISFDGNGTLTLNTCWVRNSSADSGGGIWFNGTSATQSELKLQVDTRILVNIANSGGGGGIHVQGNSLLTVSGPRAEINGNHADNGNGGGIEMIGPAKANISSPDFSEGSVVQGNSAKYGGGIAVVGNPNDSSGTSVLQLFTADPLHPVGLVGNSASHTGGGIYLHPVQALGFYNLAELYAWDYRVDDNVAAEGAAIYGDSDFDGIASRTGSFVYLGGSLYSPLPTQLGATACTDSRVCNTFNGNHAEDAVGNPTSAILMQDDGYLSAQRFSMRNNEASHVIRIVGDNTHGDLSECLIADNKGIDVAGAPSPMQELIYAAGNNVGMRISSCTFANDLIGATHMIHTESDLTLENSIVAEPGTLTVDYSGNPANRINLFVLSNDITTLPNSGNGVIPGTPEFVDPANGDYHLKATSLGVDFAPPPPIPIASQGPDTIDLDGNPRDTDLVFVGDVFGTRDLGAYELQNGFRECGTSDSVFCNGFDR